jgi:hypothetical protein
VKTKTVTRLIVAGTILIFLAAIFVMVFINNAVDIDLNL